MLSQINLILIFIIVTIELATRLFISAIGFAFLVCKALCSIHGKTQVLTSLDNTVYFNSINYPDELNYDLN